MNVKEEYLKSWQEYEQNKSKSTRQFYKIAEWPVAMTGEYQIIDKNIGNIDDRDSRIPVNIVTQESSRLERQ